MNIRGSLVAMAVLGLCLGLWGNVAPAAAAGEALVAQWQGQGGQRPRGPQGGAPQGQPPAPQGQPGGGGVGNNPCVQSHQRCVMICAGVGNCVNNCNAGYAMCMQQRGGR